MQATVCMYVRQFIVVNQGISIAILKEKAYYLGGHPPLLMKSFLCFTNTNQLRNKTSTKLIPSIYAQVFISLTTSIHS